MSLHGILIKDDSHKKAWKIHSAITMPDTTVILGYWLFLFPKLGKRIPMMKMKTLQEVVLEEIKPKYFLEEQSYSLSWETYSWPQGLISSPKENHEREHVRRAVLHSTPWGSGLALGLIWRCQVGWWGWGSCRRQRHWKTGTPQPEEKAVSSSTVSLSDWAWQLPGVR